MSFQLETLEKLSRLAPEMTRNFSQLFERSRFSLEPTMTMASVRLIQTLADASKAGPVKMSKLSKLIGVTQGTLTTNIKNLCQKGYVLRKRSEEDDRVVVLKLSVQGEKFNRDLDKARRKVMSEILSSLSDENQRKFLDSLEFIVWAQQEALKETR